MGYRYSLPYDDGNIVIRYKIGVPTQRYDKAVGKWIDDFDMCGIFSGDIPSKRITEEEAMKIISSY